MTDLLDISSRKDIEKMVHAQYKYMLADSKMNHFFTEVAKIDVLDHFDVLCDFWESVLFQKGLYKNDMLDIHLELHYKRTITDEHFSLWLEYFNLAVDENFSGKVAKGAKDRANSLITIIKLKIKDIDRKRLEMNN